MGAKTRTVRRSSKTGRFVRKSQVKRSPGTTETERVKVGRRRGK
jgi:hypothetical protein